MAHWMQTSFSVADRDTDALFTNIFAAGGFIKLEESTCTVMYNSDLNAQMQTILNPPVTAEGEAAEGEAATEGEAAPEGEAATPPAE